jgi:gas vesicle protein
MNHELEHDDHRGRAGTFVVGLLLGAAVGAATALLCSPKSGKQIRADIAERTKKARTVAADSYKHGRDRVSQFADKGRDAYGKARGIVQRTKADIKQNVEELVGTGTSHES